MFRMDKRYIAAVCAVTSAMVSVIGFKLYGDKVEGYKGKHISKKEEKEEKEEKGVEKGGEQIYCYNDKVYYRFELTPEVIEWLEENNNSGKIPKEIKLKSSDSRELTKEENLGKVRYYMLHGQLGNEKDSLLEIDYNFVVDELLRDEDSGHRYDTEALCGYYIDKLYKTLNSRGIDFGDIGSVKEEIDRWLYGILGIMIYIKDTIGLIGVGKSDEIPADYA